MAGHSAKEKLILSLEEIKTFVAIKLLIPVIA
jgi:hypothetical protein